MLEGLIQPKVGCLNSSIASSLSPAFCRLTLTHYQQHITLEANSLLRHILDWVFNMSSIQSSCLDNVNMVYLKIYNGIELGVP